MPETKHQPRGGAAPAAPLILDRRDRRQRILLGFVVASLLLAGGRLLWFLPGVQDWRLSRATLPALLKERDARPDDPRLRYHLGARLNRLNRFSEAEANLRHGVGLDPDSPRLRDEWARALLGTGDISEAFHQLRQFVGTHPDSAPGHKILGKFYFAQNSMERAREELEQAVRLKSDDAEAWAYLSQAAQQLSAPDVALDAARKAVSLAPRNAGYHLLLASLLVPANQAEAAGEEYARAAALAPDQALMRQQYAVWLLEHGKGEDAATRAEAELRQALRLDAGDATTQLLLGRLLRDSGRPEEAIPPLTRAAERDAEDPAPAQALTQVYTTLNRKAEAARWQKVWQERQTYITRRHALYQQLRVHPDSRALRRKMAELLCQHGDVEGCIRNYSAALRRPQDSTQVLTAAARDLTAGGHPGLALPLAEKAVATGPRSPEAREALGDALLYSGRMDEAIASYNYTTNYLPQRAPEIQARVNRYAAEHPQPVSPAERAYREARSLLDGQIGLKRSPERALELAQEANRLDPGNLTYLQLLLQLQFGARKTDEAIKTAEQIAAIAPQDAPTQALLGVMLAERAATPEEFARVEGYLDAAKNSPEAAAQRHYGAGLLALRRRDADRAVAELTEAAKRDPEADVTFYKLSQAERMRGNPEAAAKALQEYQRRQNLKKQEFELQGNVSQSPESPEPYQKLLHFYEQQGRKPEAAALRSVIQTRFGAGRQITDGIQNKKSTKKGRES